MTKKELIEVLCVEHAMPAKKVENIINDLFVLITKSIKDGEEVKINQFGIFKPVFRKGRKGRNPKTGETIQIPTKKTITFTLSKFLKENII